MPIEPDRERQLENLITQQRDALRFWQWMAGVVSALLIAIVGWHTISNIGVVSISQSQFDALWKAINDNTTVIVELKARSISQEEHGKLREQVEAAARSLVELQGEARRSSRDIDRLTLITTQQGAALADLRDAMAKLPDLQRKGKP